jgi:hypothetical protein
MVSMMRDPLWRFVERRLSRVVVPAHLASTVGDLAEDYARVRSTRGRIGSAWWLLRESSSLARAYRAEGVLHSPASRFVFADDVWHAWRRITARPAAPLLCALLLSIGIGLATAMFSVVDSLLLQPAPFRNADQLVQQGFWRPEPAVMEAWRTSGMFDDVEAVRQEAFRLEDRPDEAWLGAFVTPGVFDMLGVRPIRGRAFDGPDARPGSDDVVVLSETIWRSSFAADPALVGRRIRLTDTSIVVIGIMPASFRFPTPASVIWRPSIRRQPLPRPRRFTVA